MSANLAETLGKLSLAVVVALTASVATATTVRRAGLDELVHESSMVMRAHVAFVDERAGEASGKFLTRIGFEVVEGVKGVGPTTETYELVIPGGSANGLTMAIPGMPTFTPGEEVVVLLKHTAAGDTITGLGQGLFAVDRSRSVARARRVDVGDVRTVDNLGRDVRPELIDTPLAGLMLRLRTLSAEVTR